MSLVPLQSPRRKLYLLILYTSTTTTAYRGLLSYERVIPKLPKAMGVSYPISRQRHGAVQMWGEGEYEA